MALLYTSPPPRLILTAARLLAVKSVASACASAWAAHAYLSPLLLAAAPGAAAALPLSLAAALAAPHVKIALGTGALAALSAAVSRAIAARTVLQLQVAPDDAGALLITTPRLLGGAHRVQRVRLGSVQGASANSTVQGFRVAAEEGGGGLAALAPGVARARAFYLFPVEPHWRSSDLPALRRLLFAQYFREGEAAAAAAAPGSFGVSGAELTAGIAGFGPFRPAQFADPRAAAAAAAAALGEGGGGGGGGGGAGDDGSSGSAALAVQALPEGLRVAEGTVWADFALPPPPTLEERRARERERRAGRVPAQPPLPTLPPSLLPPK